MDQKKWSVGNISAGKKNFDRPAILRLANLFSFVFRLQCIRIVTPGVHLMPKDQTNTWPDLLIGLYDNLTGRRAEITYEFDNMHIKIPSGTGPSAEHAEWVLHGTMKIRTRDTGTSPN